MHPRRGPPLRLLASALLFFRATDGPLTMYACLIFLYATSSLNTRKHSVKPEFKRQAQQAQWHRWDDHGPCMARSDRANARVTMNHLHRILSQRSAMWCIWVNGSVVAGDEVQGWECHLRIRDWDLHDWILWCKREIGISNVRFYQEYWRLNLKC